MINYTFMYFCCCLQSFHSHYHHNDSVRSAGKELLPPWTGQEIGSQNCQPTEDQPARRQQSQNSSCRSPVPSQSLTASTEAMEAGEGCRDPLFIL